MVDMGEDNMHGTVMNSTYCCRLEHLDGIVLIALSLQFPVHMHIIFESNPTQKGRQKR